MIFPEWCGGGDVSLREKSYVYKISFQLKYFPLNGVVGGMSHLKKNLMFTKYLFNFHFFSMK
jgi:hypothetical protein